MAARTAADGKWVRRIVRTAADGVGAREWLEMGGGEEAAGDERAWLRGRLWTGKIDVFLRVFVRAFKFATSKSMFRGRLPSIFSTSHKMPRLPRNLHLVAT